MDSLFKRIIDKIQYFIYFLFKLVFKACSNINLPMEYGHKDALHSNLLTESNTLDKKNIFDTKKLIWLQIY